VELIFLGISEIISEIFYLKNYQKNDQAYDLS
jgi:hypothetical protein